MERFKKIEIGVLVTLTLAVISLAFYIGGKVTELQQIKLQVSKFKMTEIEKKSNIAIANINKLSNQIEKKLATYEFEPLDTRVASLEKLENLRSIISKTQINTMCPLNSYAAHVPKSFLNKSGSEICSSNTREFKGCAAVNFIYVTNSNSSGRYEPHDKGCNETVDVAWPWGSSYSDPNTLDAEWGHGNTYAVCCF
ncbi:MAG: 2-oxoglutarate dehydrogenase complex dehydrogenase (E1) component-like enzyme [Colwellia sp.]|jgi:2-oxoglutarate dehydrogenase complex dehydrogenase (E1) component-like enzyme